MINDLGNSFKHSLLNSQVSLYQGIEKPFIISLYLERNDLKNSAKFYTEDLGKILSDYDKFLSDVKGILIKLVPSK